MAFTLENMHEVLAESVEFYDADLLTAADAPRVRPDLNGVLVKAPGHSPVWLILDGVRRGYTSYEKFRRVHHRNARIIESIDVIDIQEGPAFADDIRLIRNPAGTVFLFETGRKRGFSSAAIFNLYQCDWDRVLELEQGIIDAIPSGPVIPNRS